jgi:hypothetical protein
MQEEHQQYLRTSELAIVIILWPCHWDGVPSGYGLGRHYESGSLVVVAVAVVRLL